MGSERGPARARAAGTWLFERVAGRILRGEARSPRWAAHLEPLVIDSLGAGGRGDALEDGV